MPGNSRPDQKTGYRHSDNQEKVNNGDRPDATVDKFLQSSDGGINKVGKENGKKKDDQGSARGIEKAQSHGKEKSREQDARGA